VSVPLVGRIVAVVVGAVVALIASTYYLVTLSPQPAPWVAWAYLALLLIGLSWALYPMPSVRSHSYPAVVAASFTVAVIVSGLLYAGLWFAFGGSK